ncbi:hypothetical protein [Brucella sp. NBRC 14130]|uniref:hypothetical protein n=1 Tax=Brucella sp. NBRC 14130 TaxID=3075483 RepID=UPI003340894D
MMVPVIGARATHGLRRRVSDRHYAVVSPRASGASPPTSNVEDQDGTVSRPILV